MSQPTMIFRGLDSSGDVEWGQGLSSYATGESAIALDVQTRLLMFFGDYFYALLFGIQWFQLLSSKNPAAQNGIVLQCRQMILGTVGGYASFGITAINSMSFFEDVVTRAFTLQANVSTIYSTNLEISASIPTNLI